MEIHAHQVKAFEQAAWRRFEMEMLEHSKSFSPHLTAILGDEQLLVALRAAMARAWGYGFTNRGPIRLYIELMFLCGSAFDTDPQYALLGQALRDPSDQMWRAEQIHEGHNRYMEEVAGRKNINVRNSLRELAKLVREPIFGSAADFDVVLRREMKRVFAKRYLYIGEEGITKLIEEGKSISTAYAFTEPRQMGLIVILMFAFGHGCTNDPLYPWISNTLQDDRIVYSAGRAERLERKAVTWLTHVLARDPSGVEV